MTQIVRPCLQCAGRGFVVALDEDGMLFRLPCRACDGTARRVLPS